VKDLSIEELCTLDVLIDMAIQSRDRIDLRMADCTLTLKDKTVDDLRIIQCKLSVLRGHTDVLQNYRASLRVQTGAKP
jgi:hypothetical protein